MLLNCLQRRARVPMKQMNEGWNARVAKVLQSYRFMRIIAGNFKGKKLLTPNDKFTRPLRDVVKESIFNILQHSKNVSGVLLCKLLIHILPPNKP